MASTRNKNTPGNYSAEQKINDNIGGYRTLVASSEARSGHHPGRGVLPAKTARKELCNNYTDVESQLFGIGSTNLVIPQKPTNPDYKTPNSLNFIDGLQVTLPDPLVIEKNPRPYMNH